jgi:hypothetical protein
VNRKIKERVEVTITDHGERARVAAAIANPDGKRAVARDYYSRLLKRQPKSLSPKETRQFWNEERR